MSSDPLAYLITFHTYGTWLHGRAEGSVEDDDNVPGTPLVPPNELAMSRERGLMKHPAFNLNHERRFVVHATIEEVCRHRGWRLHAINVRSTHVHAVLSARCPPERAMNDFKAYSTRRMRAFGLADAVEQPWSRHGSTRYINTEAAFVEAVKYVLHEQGAALEERAPVGWERRGDAARP